MSTLEIVISSTAPLDEIIKAQATGSGTPMKEMPAPAQQQHQGKAPEWQSRKPGKPTEPSTPTTAPPGEARPPPGPQPTPRPRSSRPKQGPPAVSPESSKPEPPKTAAQ
ncbi:hypothetical protein PLESTM_000550500 [Pleodorina starrii]|nr:hypothetical protein PLESTM_000550500 [Pleodorina starrii]